LEEHPNVREILGIVERVPYLTERETARLARGWRDNIFLAGARDHALSPGSPLIIDVLAMFDEVDVAFFASPGVGMAGDDDDSGVDTAPAEVVTTALPAQVTLASKAIRDALAAAYAKPVLSRAEYVALIGPWRRTFPADSETT
jgi:hypothetical protein